MVESKDKRRAFTRTQRNEILQQQRMKCAVCHKALEPIAIHFHHLKEWSANGPTVVKNGAAVCPTCHVKETHKQNLKKIDKPKTEKKLVTRERLNEFTLKQLKFLTTKHKIKVNGTTSSDILFGTTTASPKKRQYVNKLLGVVHEGEKLTD